MGSRRVIHLPTSKIYYGRGLYIGPTTTKKIYNNTLWRRDDVQFVTKSLIRVPANKRRCPLFWKFMRKKRDSVTPTCQHADVSSIIVQVFLSTKRKYFLPVSSCPQKLVRAFWILIPATNVSANSGYQLSRHRRCCVLEKVTSILASANHSRKNSRSRWLLRNENEPVILFTRFTFTQPLYTRVESIN